MRTKTFSLLGFPILFAILFSTLVIAPEARAEPHEYSLDRAHSSVTFGVRHFFNEVPGRFTDFEGTLVYNAENPSASRIELVVKTDSINTDLDRRDQHLRSPDFFDTAQYPEMSFRSVSVIQEEDGSLSINGDFTLRGKTKRMTIPARVLGVMELGEGAAKAAFQSEFTIDRQEFGVSWNRALDNGGTVLGNEVKIRIILQADRKLGDGG